MSVRVYGILLKVHPLLPGLWALALVTGGGNRLTPILCALLLHESGHLLAAKALGISVEEIELTPFGGVMTMKDLEAQPPLRRFLTALAGPAFSLAGCLATPALHNAAGLSFFAAGNWLRANLLLVMFNLLPVLPLDGGHMLRAALSRFFPSSAVTRALNGAAFIVGMALCGVTLCFALRGEWVLAPAFAGLYLIYAAAAEGRESTARYVTALIGRRQRLEKRETLPVEAVAAGSDTPVRTLLRSLHPGRYHRVYVLARDGMQLMGILDEDALCEALLSQNDAPLGALIDRKNPRLP